MKRLHPVPSPAIKKRRQQNGRNRFHLQPGRKINRPRRRTPINLRRANQLSGRQQPERNLSPQMRSSSPNGSAVPDGIVNNRAMSVDQMTPAEVAPASSGARRTDGQL